MQMANDQNLALIYFGANSIQLEIRKYEKGHYQLIEKIRRPLRLGLEVFQIESGQNWGRETLNAAIGSMMEFHSIIRDHEVQYFKAIITHSLAAGKNLDELISMVQEITGLSLSPVSAELETQMLYQAYEQFFEPKHDKQADFIVRVGGGSTEVVYCQNGKQVHSGAFHIGTVQLFKVLEEQGASKMIYHLNQAKKQFYSDFKSYLKNPYRLLAIGGGARRLLRLKELKQTEEGTDFSSLVELLNLRSYNEWQRYLKGHQFSQNEREVCLPTLFILSEFFTLDGPERFLIPDFSLMDGLQASIESRQVRVDVFRSHAA
jgi:exopolyphosphatase/guanosine-5'-triphosphate,3'-diphosphate pyrophosphatase